MSYSARFSFVPEVKENVSFPVNELLVFAYEARVVHSSHRCDYSGARPAALCGSWRTTEVNFATYFIPSGPRRLPECEYEARFFRHAGFSEK